MTAWSPGWTEPARPGRVRGFAQVASGAVGNATPGLGDGISWARLIEYTVYNITELVIPPFITQIRSSHLENQVAACPDGSGWIWRVTKRSRVFHDFNLLYTLILLCFIAYPESSYQGGNQTSLRRPPFAAARHGTSASAWTPCAATRR